MRKVRRLLKIDHHLDTTDLIAPEKGSVADLPAEDLLSLIRLQLSSRDPNWQKPGRNRRQYVDFKCPRPKRNIKQVWRRRRNMGFRALRKYNHLPALLCEWENFPPYRKMLEGQASSDDDSGFRLW